MAVNEVLISKLERILAKTTAQYVSGPNPREEDILVRMTPLNRIRAEKIAEYIEYRETNDWTRWF